VIAALTERAVKSIAQLRELADWLEAHPEIDSFCTADAVLCALDGAEFAQMTRAIGGGAKNADEKNIEVIRTLPHGATITVFAPKAQTCRLVQTGERTVERPIMVQRGVERVVEPIMEWKCPESFLALGEPS
jgi:hypothetical protein